MGGIFFSFRNELNQETTTASPEELSNPPNLVPAEEADVLMVRDCFVCKLVLLRSRYTTDFINQDSTRTKPMCDTLVLWDKTQTVAFPVSCKDFPSPILERLGAK